MLSDEQPPWTLPILNELPYLKRKERKKKVHLCSSGTCGALCCRWHGFALIVTAGFCQRNNRNGIKRAVKESQFIESYYSSLCYIGHEIKHLAWRTCQTWTPKSLCKLLLNKQKKDEATITTIFVAAYDVADSCSWKKTFLFEITDLKPLADKMLSAILRHSQHLSQQ